MISIVLPSYNGEKYIRQSIESVLRQTYLDWELIIVNDCSTDSTGSIAEEYQKKDSRIRVIHNSNNKKLPRSLNIGFEDAKGEFFTWTSDDNAFAKNALERMLFVIRQDSQIDLVFSNYTVIDPDDYILFEVKTGPVNDLYYKDVIGASFLYKREVHESIQGFDPDKFLVEDYDFWLRAKRKHQFLHLDEMLYYYRIHGSSLTAEREDAVKEETIRLITENMKYIPGELPEIKKKVEDVIASYKKSI